MKKIFYKVFVCSFLDIAAFLFCYNSQAQVVINEVYYNPANGLQGDANGDGVRSASQDEFVELVNRTATVINVSSWTLADADGIFFTVPLNTNLAAHQALVVFGGGLPNGNFGHAKVFIKNLGLNNADNLLVLRDGNATKIDSMAYKANDGVGVSLTRNPDVTGNFEDFSQIGNGTILFSPGLTSDLKSFETILSGVNEVINTTHFKCFPNPVTKSFSYTSSYTSLLKLSLIDVTGNVFPVTYDATFIMLPDFISPGVYWLKIDVEDGVLMHKIVVL
jgi:hypothetical protein